MWLKAKKKNNTFMVRTRSPTLKFVMQQSRDLGIDLSQHDRLFNMSGLRGITPLGHPNQIQKNSRRMSWFSSGRKNSLKIKFLGRIFPGPRRRDIPDKNFMQVGFFCCFRQGVAGMSRDLGPGCPGMWKNFMQEKFGADFSFPISEQTITHSKVWGRLAFPGAGPEILEFRASCSSGSFS